MRICMTNCLRGSANAHNKCISGSNMESRTKSLEKDKKRVATARPVAEFYEDKDGWKGHVATLP